MGLQTGANVPLDAFLDFLLLDVIILKNNDVRDEDVST